MSCLDKCVRYYVVSQLDWINHEATKTLYCICSNYMDTAEFREKQIRVGGTERAAYEVVELPVLGMLPPDFGDCSCQN